MTHQLVLFMLSLATLLGVTPALAGAVYPLNQARFRFIYPEDNQIFGVSMNTNVGPTTVQAELSYRPDFPLATNAGDKSTKSVTQLVYQPH